MGTRTLALSPKDPKATDDAGAHRFVRHPIYIANVFVGLGTTLISELLWLVSVTFLWYLIIYQFVVRYEEAHLLEKYREAYQILLHTAQRLPAAGREIVRGGS